MNLPLRKPRLLIEVGQVWVAAMIANLLLYLFQLVAGRGLGPEEYGLFGALFGIIYLAGALSNGIQVTVAKFVAEAFAQGDDGKIATLVFSVSLQMIVLGVGVFVLFTVASPWLGSYVHSNGITPVIITGAVIWASLVVPVTRGAMQGAQRFLAFSATQILHAGSRLGFGVAALAMNLGVVGVLVAVGLSSLVTTVVGLAIVRPAIRGTLTKLQVGGMAKILVPTTIGALAINLPTSADVVIVRHFFSATDAGLYTGAAVLGRVVVFLPLAVSIVFFPKFAQEWARGNPARGLLYKGLGVTALMSGAACLALVAAPEFALVTFLGAEFSGAQSLVPLYASAMFFFSISVVFLYYHLAAGRKTYLLLLLPHLALELGLIYVFHQSLTQVVLVLLSVNISLAVLSEVYTRAMVSWTPAHRLAAAK